MRIGKAPVLDICVIGWRVFSSIDSVFEVCFAVALRMDGGIERSYGNGNMHIQCA